MPYLLLSNAAGFIDFAAAVFGATEQYLVKRDDGVIQHAELRMGDAVIMVAEATDSFKARPSGMFLYVENVDVVYALALHHGARSLMPVGEQPYGKTCGFEDQWGNQWWPTEPR